jgi:hypothetical protein
MRDIEAAERREARRHEVARGIVEAVHRATRDADDYRADFHALAALLLGRLGPSPRPGPTGTPVALALYGEHVAPAIAAEAGDAVEADMLHLMVFEGVFVSVSAGTRSAMLRSEMSLAA